MITRSNQSKDLTTADCCNDALMDQEGIYDGHKFVSLGESEGFNQAKSFSQSMLGFNLHRKL